MNYRCCLWWGCLAIAGSLPGCAIYDPWQVWRHQCDYNSQRALSTQIVFYDHLPPTPVRTRLMQWGYNVGPSGPPAMFTIPAGTPIGAPSGAPGTSRSLPAPVPPSPGIVPPQVQPPDLLDRSRPPDMVPSQTPAELNSPRNIAPPGPTAGSPSVIQRLNSAEEAPTPQPSAVWLFK